MKNAMQSNEEFIRDLEEWQYRSASPVEKLFMWWDRRKARLAREAHPPTREP